MPRMNIFNALEREAFDAPPVLTSAERKQYFDFPIGLLKLAATLRTPTNIVCFLTTAGYFRATRKFFAGSFSTTDLEYVAYEQQIAFSEVNPETYDKQTAGRHRRLIIEFFGFTELNLASESIIREEMTSLIRARLKPRLILVRVVESLIRHRVVVPSYDLLSKLILEQLHEYKATIVRLIEEHLSEMGRQRLDALLEKEGTVVQDGPGSAHRYRLTLLKKFSQSTKPSKINASIEDLHILQTLYLEFEPIIEKLNLTSEGVRHYAGSVIRSEIFQLTRRSDQDRYLHLLAFIAHQYFGLQDTLVEIFLKSVQSFLGGVRREHKDLWYQHRPHHTRQIRSLVRLVDGSVLGTLSQIKTIAHSNLADQEKVEAIKQVLDLAEPQKEQLQNQITPLISQTGSDHEDEDFYRIIEQRSLALQKRTTPILKAVAMAGTASSAGLMEAIDFFKTKLGLLGRGTPLSFLDDHEQSLIWNQAGKLRTSLYKALLMVKTADAIKSGTINVNHSSKYRPLTQYLIPQPDWEQYRETYVQQAGLENVRDVQAHLLHLRQTLDDAYHTTNRNILNQSNPHITFNPSGEFIVTTPKIAETDTEPLGHLFPEKKYISLLEILSTLNRLTGFLDEFGHWQLRYNRPKPHQRVFIAGIVSQGCDIGVRQMAHISTHVSESELEHTLNWYFTIDGIHNAIDRLLSLMNRLDLPQLYRRHPHRLHTSSDGQKFEVERESLNASRSFKYFGSGQGVSVHTFIDERHLLFHSTVVSAAERESAYVIDGLMHNDVVKSDLHSTDTHGYSEVIFATMHLLGFSFAPRIKKLNQQQLYAFERRRSYEDQNYRILPDTTINPKFIPDNWDDMLRFAATIKLKITTASDIFRRLNSYSRQHSLYRALKELGKILKSQHVLRWVDDVTYRQAIEKQLNKGEHEHRLSRAVTLGNPRQFSQCDKQEQEIAEGCKRLIKTAIICWNYLYLSQTIADEPDQERRTQLIEAVRLGSVVCWRHINMLGEYDFSEEKLQDSIGFQLPKILGLKVSPLAGPEVGESNHPL